VARSYDEFKELQQSCIDDGLLTPAFGRGNLRITKKGRQLVKLAAIAVEEVASALEWAVHTPLLERRQALVTVVLVAREREQRDSVQRSQRSE
jgi:hypothetical protein